MTLWDKGSATDAAVQKFATGTDYITDAKLVGYDCDASIAHTHALACLGLISPAEQKLLARELGKIKKDSARGTFVIMPEDEDCHTAIEKRLTSVLGSTGKKIHLARSRNDQVLCAIRLYEKDMLNLAIKRVQVLMKETGKKISANQNAKMPGYTHMRKAMPSTVSAWLGAYVEAMKDDATIMKSALALIDRSVLGSAAGFGTGSICLNRKKTAGLLGFSGIIENPVYCQMSRGKYELVVLGSLSQVMLDLNRLATELLIFSTDEFGFVKLPDELTTGSSIMPQKKNPDALELVRASYHCVAGEMHKLQGIVSGLMSGYSRDLQLTKEPVISSFERTIACLEVMAVIVSKMVLDTARMKSGITEEMHAAEKAMELAMSGMPFRDAYREVAKTFK